ncbi:MAG: hypothetical protein WBA93_00080 [Microcoleaceae cyanobacterium]
MLETWRSKSGKLGISVQELGIKIQDILQVNSRLKSERNDLVAWVKNLEKGKSELQ